MNIDELTRSFLNRNLTNTNLTLPETSNCTCCTLACFCFENKDDYTVALVATFVAATCGALLIFGGMVMLWHKYARVTPAQQVFSGNIQEDTTTPSVDTESQHLLEHPQPQ